MVAVTLALGCRSQDYKSVSLQPAPTPPLVQEHGPEPLRVGLAPILSAQGGGEALAKLCQALSKELDRPVVPFLGTDYREVNDMIGLGQLDVGIVCAGAYADPRLAQVSEPLLVPLLIGSGNTYQSLVVVQERSPLHSFEDLKGSSFELTDSLSLTGYIYPVSRLYAMGQKPGTFFSSVGFSHSHDRSLSMVAGGSVSAAAVDSSVFKVWQDRYPEEAKRVRILERSEPFPSPPIVVQRRLSDVEKENLRDAFLKLETTKEGKAILKRIGWTGFQRPDAVWQRGMQNLNLLFRKLRAKNCLPT